MFKTIIDFRDGKMMHFKYVHPTALSPLFSLLASHPSLCACLPPLLPPPCSFTLFSVRSPMPYPFALLGLLPLVCAPVRRYVLEVLERGKEHFSKIPTIQTTSVPAGTRLTICGDTHGQLEDLYSIFTINGPPSPTNRVRCLVFSVWFFSHARGTTLTPLQHTHARAHEHSPLCSTHLDTLSPLAPSPTQARAKLRVCAHCSTFSTGTSSTAATSVWKS